MSHRGSETNQAQEEVEALLTLMTNPDEFLALPESDDDTNIVQVENKIESQISDQSHAPRISLSGGSCKRKHNSEQDTSSESDHHKSPKTTHVKPSANLKFACPFFKKDSSRFHSRQACSGPGFSSISRVKEHLYRAHKHPDYQCIRCYSTFVGRDLLEEHQRAEAPCKKSVNEVSDLINEQQRALLRRKPSGQKTDVERWEEVYRIVFPKASIIPSCYYDSQDTATPVSKTDSFDTKQIKNALVEGIQKDLYDCFVQVDGGLKARFVNMIQNRVESTIKEFLEKNDKSGPNMLPLLDTPADSPVALGLELPTYEFGTDGPYDFRVLDPDMEDFALNGQELGDYDDDSSSLQLQDLTA